MTNQFIKPNEYIFITKQLMSLFNVYKSINDSNVIKTKQALTRESIQDVLGDNTEVNVVIEPFMNPRITKKQVDQILEKIKEFVEPFSQPSNQQISKVLKKVKKLKLPSWSEYDLKKSSYIGWNDKGTNRKLMVMYENEELIGFSGIISPNVQKSVCAICNEVSEVVLFLATTKSSADGTYTKRGNYICYDSMRCNNQLSDLQGLIKFIETIKSESK